MFRLFRRLEKALAGIEAVIAVCGLSMMLVLACTQIIARNLFETGFPTADTLLRYLVLLVSFSGALLAIKEHRHIKIDVALTWLPDRWRHVLERGFNFFSSAVCAVLAWAAARFWWLEWQFASSHEKWIAGMALILPVSFMLLALHFVLRGLLGSSGAELR